ncbi:MAG: hypothetical protein MMC33_009429 [Icmadophila ericetorum]|nr:hypothetical protein [Icmadophila ericetorum]
MPIFAPELRGGEEAGVEVLEAAFAVVELDIVVTEEEAEVVEVAADETVEINPSERETKRRIAKELRRITLDPADEGSNLNNKPIVSLVAIMQEEAFMVQIQAGQRLDNNGIGEKNHIAANAAKDVRRIRSSA